LLARLSGAIRQPGGITSGLLVTRAQKQRCQVGPHLRFTDLVVDPTLCEKYPRLCHRANPPTTAASVVTRNADQTLDKRFNSSAQPSTTMICLAVVLSWSSSLIIRKRLPSAVTSKLEEVAPGGPHELLIPCE
jgi:hypothetical protein